MGREGNGGALSNQQRFGQFPPQRTGKTREGGGVEERRALVGCAKKDNLDMENAFLMEQLCSSTDFAKTLKNGGWKFYIYRQFL